VDTYRIHLERLVYAICWRDKSAPFVSLVPSHRTWPHLTRSHQCVCIAQNSASSGRCEFLSLHLNWVGSDWSQPRQIGSLCSARPSSQAVADSRLRPRCATHLLDFIAEQNFSGINLDCCTCHVLLPLRNMHGMPQGYYMKIWRHPQNRKYITYRNTVRGGSSHGYIGNMPKKSVKFGRVVLELCKQTERQTNKQTDRHTHHNTLWDQMRWDMVYESSLAITMALSTRRTRCPPAKISLRRRRAWTEACTVYLSRLACLSSHTRHCGAHRTTVACCCCCCCCCIFSTVPGATLYTALVGCKMKQRKKV